LPDPLKIVQGHFVFQEIRWTTFMGVRRGGKTRFCSPWKLSLRTKKC